LKAIASNIRFGWYGNDTMNTTALVHEAYIKLLNSKHLSFDSKLHFYRICGKAMRQILQNHVKHHEASKRGGDVERVSYEENMPVVTDEQTMEYFDQTAKMLLSLQQLERQDDVISKVVECRFFSELTIDETARVLSISPATVKRKWSFARAFLHQQLSKSA